MPYEFYGGQGYPEAWMPGAHATEFSVRFGGEEHEFDSYDVAKEFYASIDGISKALWQWNELLEAHTWK